MSDLTCAELRRLVRYEPLTGAFYWIKPGPGRRLGRAGCQRKDGRWVLRVNYKLYLCSRLVFLYMSGEWPAEEIDHDDNDCSNDKWVNLFPASRVRNQMNNNATQNSQTGLRGVYPYKGDRYQAQIGFEGRIYHLGIFKTLNEAKKAREEAQLKFYGEVMK